MPAILLLLVFGLAAGPIAGILKPDELFGGLLLPLVSISVALILYEGGLTLRFADIKETGHVVRNLITIGVAAGWALITALAIFVLDASWQVALLLGAILIVSGPTVIIPLLQLLRPSGSVGPIAKWEGILIDPVGAILAVLAAELVLAASDTGFGWDALIRFGSATVIGTLAGSATAILVILMLRYYAVPDSLQNSFSLAMVVLAYASSNALQPESGLLAATVMGLVLANQTSVSVKHIVDFKENLRVLIISSLFIVLAARIELRDLVSVLNFRTLIFVALLVLLVRPLVVWLCTLRSKLTRQERAFLAALAPRGIVAVSISAIVSEQLAEANIAGADILAPLTFVVVVATVAIYGLFAFPVARWLKLAQRNPQGVILLGAHDWARKLATILKGEEIDVVLVDNNWKNISEARMQGLRTHYGSILSRRVLEEIELHGVSKLVALTPNDEANSLAALHFAELFGRSEVYQLRAHTGGADARRTTAPLHLNGRFLFAHDVTYDEISSRFNSGHVFKATKLSEQFSYQTFCDEYGSNAIAMFVVHKDGMLKVISADTKPSPKPGQTLIGMIAPDKADARKDAKLVAKKASREESKATVNPG